MSDNVKHVIMAPRSDVEKESCEGHGRAASSTSTTQTPNNSQKIPWKIPSQFEFQSSLQVDELCLANSSTADGKSLSSGPLDDEGFTDIQPFWRIKMDCFQTPTRHFLSSPTRRMACLTPLDIRSSNQGMWGEVAAVSPRSMSCHNTPAKASEVESKLHRMLNDGEAAENASPTQMRKAVTSKLRRFSQDFEQIMRPTGTTMLSIARRRLRGEDAPARAEVHR